jgi:hypothetical protein
VQRSAAQRSAGQGKRQTNKPTERRRRRRTRERETREARGEREGYPSNELFGFGFEFLVEFDARLFHRILRLSKRALRHTTSIHPKANSAHAQQAEARPVASVRT